MLKSHSQSIISKSELKTVFKQYSHTLYQQIINYTILFHQQQLIFACDITFTFIIHRTIIIFYHV